MIPDDLARLRVRARQRAELDRLRALDAETDELAAMAAALREQLLRELVAAGHSDAEVAAELGCTARMVRSARARAGVQATRRGGRPRTDWEPRLREAHARGLTTTELAAELGWARKTVEQRLWRCQLPANRPAKEGT